MKWYKFGFTRLFDNLSLEIRNNRIGRDQAIEIIYKKGIQKPTQDIEKFCEFAKIKVDTFNKISEKFRNLDIWKTKNGCWYVEDFLLKDWKWDEV
jgi:predicted DNA-binding antitoxin AbrB/MazE fold protein